MVGGYALQAVKKLAGWGAEIRRLRADAGWTQATLANALGVSQGSVSDWETETNIPSVVNLLDLAALLHSDVNHLVVGLSKQYDRLGLTSPVSDASTNGGTKTKGGAPDGPASAQARIRELEQELDDLKTAISKSAVELSGLAGNERLRTAGTSAAQRRRKNRKPG